MSLTVHRPVLLSAVVRMLDPDRGGVYLDATLGGGGYSEALLAAGADRVIGLDWDEAAIGRASERLARFGSRFTAVRAGFEEARRVIGQLGITGLNGLTADLGLSSDQLAGPGRGFSFMTDDPLDMRMDQRRDLTAADLVADLSEAELKSLLSRYGEERMAGRVARVIAEERRREPITTTGRLAQVVSRAKGAAGRKAKIHPATQTFQALRVAVNGELDQLERLLADLPDLLNPGGRAVVVSYHSLEDRLVKNAFRDGVKGCTCPPDKPCVCGKQPVYRPLTTKPVAPDGDEVDQNPRARSAKLRAVERI